MKGYWIAFLQHAALPMTVILAATIGVSMWYLRRTSTEDPKEDSIRKAVVAGLTICVGLMALYVAYQYMMPHVCVPNSQSLITLLVPGAVAIGAAVFVWYMYDKIPIAGYDSTTKGLITGLLAAMTLLAFPAAKRILGPLCVPDRSSWRMKGT